MSAASAATFISAGTRHATANQRKSSVLATTSSAIGARADHIRNNAAGAGERDSSRGTASLSNEQLEQAKSTRFHSASLDQPIMALAIVFDEFVFSCWLLTTASVQSAMVKTYR